MTAPQGAVALAVIRCLSELPADRPVTPAQADLLALWPGWGPLAGAFAPRPEPGWRLVRDELRDLTCDHPGWLESGAASCDTSFFTPDWLVTRLTQVLRDVGFAGGRVLEPGCGSGRFMSAGLPGAVWTGVEVDPVSARIASLLHPDATIIGRPLEEVTFRDGAFDAAIGNVPFSPVAPYDPEITAPNLHAYFLMRALRAVRPGGYVVAIASRGVMDAPDQLEAITDLAALRAAVRLPSGTFTATATIADVLVLQRLADNAESSPGEDAATADVERWLLPGSNPAVPPVPVNGYWQMHPTHVAGVMATTGWSQAPIEVVSPDPRTAALAALDAACAVLPALPARPTLRDDDLVDVVLADPDGRAEGSYHLNQDDAVVRIEAGRPVAVPKPSAELRALVTLRDKVSALLDADAQHARDPISGPDWCANLRKDAREAYEGYVSRFGPLNRGTLHEDTPDPETGEPRLSWRRPPMGGFRRDPSASLVMACETYSQDSGEATPAPVLLRPVNRVPSPVERVATPAEALAVTLGERAEVDLDRVAGLLGLPDAHSALTALGDLVYGDPATGRWTSARDYLAGNVREKLVVATKAAADDPRFDRNVDALRAALPAELGPMNISVALGAPWVPAWIVEAFTRDVLGFASRVVHVPVLGLWDVVASAEAQSQVAWGTNARTPVQLLSAALNGSTVTVYDERPDARTGRVKRVRNVPETVAADAKITSMQDRFGVWVWEDAERAKTLTREFNLRFRSHLPRRSDGSGLTFPGLAEGIELWPWQRDIVDRILSSPRTLCGHPVGAGKTRSMVLAACSLRRLGLANKPMIVVPGYLLEQVAREAAQTMPSARFLVATKDDLAAKSRRLFAARCATGSWDAVFMSHESFGSIPVRPELEEMWIAEQKAELADLIRNDPDRSSRSKTAKAVATAMKRFDSRLKELRATRRDVGAVWFDQLGVDFLAVDEVMAFRRLAITTRMDGFGFGASKRATDLMLKVTLLGRERGDRPHFAGFTGTVWSNTLAETYVWQKFFQPARLEEAGISTFDAWGATFVRYETAAEVAPDGSGFRMHRRPSQVTNVRVLMAMLGEVAELMPSDALPLERPEVTRTTLVVPASEQQRAFVRSLVARADAIRRGMPEPETDNMLVVCNDGRRVALDPSLVGLPGQSAKIAKAADNIASIHHRLAGVSYPGSPASGVLQLAFCDIGTPHPSDPGAYGRLKAALVERGVPAERIRFIHEATNARTRAGLHAACRDGSVSVLIGSTAKVGIGTNIQNRLAVEHHIDPPWRPADIEQREGRALRPGNLNAKVLIVRYVTEGTFDAYMWQTLERKARFIHALLAANADVDTVPDIGEVVLSFGEVKALAAGNPLLLQHTQKASDVRRLRMLRAVWLQQVGAFTKAASDAEADSQRLTRQAEAITRCAEAWAQAGRLGPDTDGAAWRAQAEVLVTAWADDPNQTVETRVHGLGVALQRSGRHTGRAVELAVRVGHGPSAGTVTVTRKALRADGAAALLDALSEWVEAAPRTADELLEKAERARTRGLSAATAASHAVFDQDGALRAAELDLSAIEAEMARFAEADPEDGAPAQVHAGDTREDRGQAA